MPPEPPKPDEQPQTKVTEAKPSSDFSGIISTLLIIVATLLVAFALTSFVFQSYEVDGPSMQSTLHNGDRLIVLKTRRTLERITHKVYLPKRDTIIVFTKHGTVEQGDKGQKQLIKRVVGVPGDRIVIKDGKVTVFNSDHPSGYDPDAQAAYADVTPSNLGSDIDQIVPADEVFVLGDNRGNSLDSRFFGTVHANDIVGELSIRIFPLNQAKKF